MSFGALFLEMFCNMDYLDFPKACPLVEGSPFRYSVGFYRGRRRRYVFAWFDDPDTAFTYCRHMRNRFPHLNIDVLKSLF